MIKPKKSIEKLEEYNQQKLSRNSFVRMDFNENTVGCSEKVVKAIRKLDRGYFSIYPEYIGLNKNVASYCKAKENEIIVTNGSDAALKLIIDSFVNKNEESIILNPSFAMLEIFLKIAGAKIKKINYNDNFTFPAGKLLKTITKKTRIILLCNPNNPTGTLISRNNIIKILNKAKNSAVVIDEAYYEFSKETVKDLINKYENLFVTRTLSKAFGLAGLRAGYVVSNKKNIQILKNVYGPFEVSSLTKIAMESALNDLNYMKKYVAEVKKNKKIIEKELQKLKIKIYPSKSNFILAKFRDSGVIKEALKEKNILVRDMSKYPLLKNYLRITIGARKETKLFTEAIKDILKPALIFDMDGVLVDVSNSYRTAIKKTAEFFTDSDVNYGEIQSYKNKLGFNNDWDLTEAITLSRGKNIKKANIIRKFQNYYLGKNFNGLINNERWLLDKNLLKKLFKNYKLAIVTGRPRKEAEYTLKNNNTAKFFPVLIALEDISRDKPDPEGILKALDELKVESAVYFGDTKNDEIAAKRAGVNFKFVSQKCKINFVEEEK